MNFDPQSLVGYHQDQATALLNNNGISYRIISLGSHTDTADYVAERVNLVVSPFKLVTHVYKG